MLPGRASCIAHCFNMNGDELGEFACDGFACMVG